MDAHTVAGAREVIRTERAEWTRGENFVLGIFDRDDRTMLGGTGFHPRGGTLGPGTTEIGMWMHVDHAGRGLATEVLLAMLTWGFTAWDWQRIEWRCDPENHASVAVARKADMTLEDRIRGEQNTDVYAAFRP